MLQICTGLFRLWSASFQWRAWLFIHCLTDWFPGLLTGSDTWVMTTQLAEKLNECLLTESHLVTFGLRFTSSPQLILILTQFYILSSSIVFYQEKVAFPGNFELILYFWWCLCPESWWCFTEWKGPKNKKHNEAKKESFFFPTFSVSRKAQAQKLSSKSLT